MQNMLKLYSVKKKSINFRKIIKRMKFSQDRLEPTLHGTHKKQLRGVKNTCVIKHKQV